MASKAATRGINTEHRLINSINVMDELGKEIINFIQTSYGYNLLNCKARKGESGSKTDIIISCDKVDTLLSVKAFDVTFDYNHLDRHFLDSYNETWNMPEKVYRAMKLYVGEVDIQGNPISINEIETDAGLLNTSPGKLAKSRRKFLHRQDEESRRAVISYFKSNRDKILKSIFIADEDIKFFIIARREVNEVCYYIQPTENIFSIYGTGDVSISNRGNIKFYKTTAQRKGGNSHTKQGWRDRTASHLQFKISPSLCIKNLKPIFCESIQ